MPDFARQIVSNIISNLDDIIVTVNDLLQFKPYQMVSDFLRFLVNSTLGIGGVLDVASSIGLSKHDEDFDQTLGVWGLPMGPYLILPFLGPSSLRGIIGLICDATVIVFPLSFLFLKKLKIAPFKIIVIVVFMIALSIIDNHSRNYEQSAMIYEASTDSYDFIKNAYFAGRNYLEKDSVFTDQVANPTTVVDVREEQVDSVVKSCINYGDLSLELTFSALAKNNEKLLPEAFCKCFANNIVDNESSETSDLIAAKFDNIKKLSQKKLDNYQNPCLN